MSQSLPAVPKLPVPPNAVLIYDVKLVGINGINIPTDDPGALGTRIPYDYQVAISLSLSSARQRPCQMRPCLCPL
jgi:hypothetical protein